MNKQLAFRKGFWCVMFFSTGILAACGGNANTSQHELTIPKEKVALDVKSLTSCKLLTKKTIKNVFAEAHDIVSLPSKQLDEEVCIYRFKIGKQDPDEYRIKLLLKNEEITLDHFEDLVKYFNNDKEVLDGIGDKAYLLKDGRVGVALKNQLSFYVEADMNQKRSIQTQIDFARAFVREIAAQ